MSAHLSRLRLFQRHLRSLVWVWVWVWDWIHWHASPRTRSPSSRHPPLTHYPFPPRSLVCGGQTSPRKPRLVVSHSTCPPLSPSPHAHSFVLGTAVINNKQQGSRSPDGLVVGSCTSHPWSFGFNSQTRGTRENRATPCVKVSGSSRVPSLGPPTPIGNNTLTIRTFLFSPP
jgi:hypothetical protein